MIFTTEAKIFNNKYLPKKKPQTDNSLLHCCYMTNIFLGKCHTHVSLPKWGSMTDKSRDITKVRLEEPMTFTGVIYRNVGEGLVTGAEIIQRQLRYQGSPQHG